MTDDTTAAVFEGERSSLLGLAYRLLGSRTAAEDAVQDAWLRLAAADIGSIANLPGWLRTVVTRLCLDQLRVRRAVPATSGSAPRADQLESIPAAPGPEEIVELADEVSRVLLVVLSRLTPVERVALVLHDMFAVPYAEIGHVVGKSAETTKKLTGRARGKVRGTPRLPASSLHNQRAVVSRFLDAARAGDLERVISVLAPDVTRTADPGALPPGRAPLARGAREVAAGAMAFAARSRQSDLALIDGSIGLVMAPQGRLLLAVTFRIEADRIVHYEVIAEPARLDRLNIALPPSSRLA